MWLDLIFECYWAKLSSIQHHRRLQLSIPDFGAMLKPCLRRNVLNFFFYFSPKMGNLCPNVWKIIYGFLQIVGVVMHLLNKKSYSDRKCKDGISNLYQFKSFNVILNESALKLMKNFRFFRMSHFIIPIRCLIIIIWKARDPCEKPKAPSQQSEASQNDFLTISQFCMAQSSDLVLSMLRWQLLLSLGSNQLRGGAIKFLMTFGSKMRSQGTTIGASTKMNSAIFQKSLRMASVCIFMNSLLVPKP